jgi:sortase A
MNKLTFTHRQVNNWLTAIVVGMGLYIAVLPWLPNVGLWINQLFDSTDGYVYRGDLSAGRTNEEQLSDPPKDNRLVVPSIALDEPVVEGGDLSVIGSGGTWRRPNTSSPDRGGNTVIVGHRFSYSDPATFYHLDKISVGERLAIWWEEKEYVYEVFETTVVPASAVSIEGASDQSIVTLYTCTPIWTATNRLVVKAKLISGEEF